MASSNNTKKPCCKCSKGGATFTCDGCRLSFCLKHASDHRQELSLRMNNIGQQHDLLKQSIEQDSLYKTLLQDIDEWEKETIEKIRTTANMARADLKRLEAQCKTGFNEILNGLSDEFRSHRENDDFTEQDLDRWMKQLEELHQEVTNPTTIHVVKEQLLPICSVRNKKTETSKNTNINLLPHYSAYLSMIFGLNVSTTTNKHIQRLFDELMLLPMMDKNGPMSGKCEFETNQMEQFLTNTFGFQNIPGKYIVQGVRAFQLVRPPKSLPHDHKIHFPCKSESSFTMTVREIQEWQSTYRVYADKDIEGMAHDFLKQALQGKSGDGEEAFRMKFVVRISTCPILMEFDGKVIPRKLSEDWPNRIKLVSVTGIDFAGRKHDVDDILYYIKNWADIFEVDHTQTKPALLNERDFARRRGAVVAELNEGRLFTDLRYMASLRLRACDEEGVQIVVETGIGLGVFSGRHIGIDERVRTTSAIAIRTVLEEEAASYRNIRAVVFALPIFEKGTSDEHIRDTYHTFTEQFAEPQYNGRIPVLIADQDMHRLTVAIARQGFIVSELNPAGSHGVFSEYWQNGEPSLEEKVALTTVGLLVQHHLINPEVLHKENYNLI
ncbi:hypothetical protein I4U23_020437 [Adineta vaga]|nr:hypothetical protein I4U23_020437 [Adineta vaga]